MKACRTRTLRGILTSETGAFKRRIIIDDGRNNYGLKVVGFKVWTTLEEPSAYGWFKLSLDVQPVGPNYFDASDNRQIAWTTFGYVASPTQASDTFETREILDPDHIVNRDLYLEGMGSHSPVAFNYMIICQEYELTDDEAIITLIKETSQNTTH